MDVFKIVNQQASSVDIEDFKLEKELHQFFEKNLQSLLGIRFVEREYEANATSGRIDTLGLDESNRPVIIEYKLGTATDEVLTQGRVYQKHLNGNRKHFNFVFKNKYDVEVDWQMVRLIFIAKDFSQRLKDAVEGDKDITLVRYARFKDGLLVLEPLSGKLHSSKKQPMTSFEPKDGEIEGVERYLKQTKPEFRELFLSLRQSILEMSDITETIQPKVGITYYKIQAIARFEFGKNYINVLLKSNASSRDTGGRLRDITNHKWGFPFLFRIETVDDFAYAFHLIEGSS